MPLLPNEASQNNFYVAIDAEFVKTREEEFTLTLDKERQTLRPARQTPGRISVLRIKNSETDDEDAHRDASTIPLDEVPFIDDYIIVHDPIVNYETKYSGLEPGDLDPAVSPFNLQHLKVVYKKLWLLLNLGCIFVGHGLESDLRVLNLYVPPCQIIDTVHLFHLPNSRYISLRFLAYFFLSDENVQSGNHDSIVDATTALRLWRKYKQLEAEGTLQAQLRRLYWEGPRTEWLPPSEYRLKYPFRQTGFGAGLTTGTATPDSRAGGLSGRATPIPMITTSALVGSAPVFVPSSSGATASAPTHLLD